jgi:dolichol-phosphate mannosyltransferase
MEQKKKISVVIPEYCGESMLPELLKRLHATLQTITESYEIILVNDCSPDHVWEAIRQVCAIDKRVVGLNLSRNFGEHYAISAGLRYAKGEYIVVMDCDLQNRPEDIPALYQKAQEGWDVVHARRLHKKFGIWKRMSSSVFHAVYDWMTGHKSDSSIAEFGIYSARIIREYNKLGEVARSFNFLIEFLGFRVTAIDGAHDSRADGGGSSYTFRKLFRLAMDSIIADSTRPLKMAVVAGFTMSLVSVMMAVYNVIAYFFELDTVRGYTTTIFSIWFACGLLLFVMGVLGLYIGRIFDQVKARPIFIVMDELNVGED